MRLNYQAGNSTTQFAIKCNISPYIWLTKVRWGLCGLSGQPRAELWSSPPWSMNWRLGISRWRSWSLIQWCRCWPYYCKCWGTCLGCDQVVRTPPQYDRIPRPNVRPLDRRASSRQQWPLEHINQKFISQLFLPSSPFLTLDTFHSGYLNSTYLSFKCITIMIELVWRF